MPLPYYEHLSKKQKRIYDKSAAITSVPLKNPRAIRPRVVRLEEALATGKRKLVQDAARSLVGSILHDLGAPGLQLVVKDSRPKSRSFELHGLYEREDDGSAQITVWMRTAARKDVVRFRTFLRTLLHEVLHHLDYVHFELQDSLHTEGFYARESSLLRQLVPEAKKPQKSGKTMPAQLSLFPPRLT